MNKKFQLVNPIVRKDLRVISRSMKYSWGLFAYEAVLAIAFCLTMLSISAVYRYSSFTSNTEVYEGYVAFFPVVGVSQLCIISLIVPIITASSISGERERKTLDVLLTTTITPVNIIIGKLTSAVLRVMTFVVASIPLMAVSFIMGGMSWFTLVEYIVLAFIFAIFTGSIGIFCSSICKKSIPAIIMAYVIYGVVYGGCYLPMIVIAIIFDGIDDFYLILLSQLINPVTSFLLFFVNKLSDEDLISLFANSANTTSFWDWIFSTNVWLFISSILQLGVAAFFIWLASLKLRPGNK